MQPEQLGHVYFTSAPFGARDVHLHPHPLREAEWKDIVELATGQLRADPIEDFNGMMGFLLRPHGNLDENKRQAR